MKKSGKKRDFKRFKGLSISLIVPARNAEKNLFKTLRLYTTFLSRICLKYEIIIACNDIREGDKTLEIAKDFAKKNRNIAVLNIKERGKGFAILAGFKKAKYEVIGFMDSDGVFALPYVKNMLSVLQDGEYDCVIASKWFGKKILEVKEPLSRKILAIVWNILSRVLFRLKINDTQAGCKFTKKKVFDDIMRYGKFICSGFDFDIEFLFKIQRKGYKIKEFFVPIKPEKFSTFHLRYIPGMFWHMLRVWNKIFLGEI